MCWPTAQGPGSISTSLCPFWALNALRSRLQMSISMLFPLSFIDTPSRGCRWLCNIWTHAGWSMFASSHPPQQCGKRTPVKWDLLCPQFSSVENTQLTAHNVQVCHNGSPCGRWKILRKFTTSVINLNHIIFVINVAAPWEVIKPHNCVNYGNPSLKQYTCSC